MDEREPNKEIIERGELFYLTHSPTHPLTHPETEKTFSGYGLTTVSDRKEHLAGLLMVDRPQPADPSWLKTVEDVYGECNLVAMTATGERGLACNMQIDNDSLPYLRRFPSEKSSAIQKELEPLLDNPPKPSLSLYWDEEASLWRSRFAFPNKLPQEISEVFENTGYGCLAAETNIGVVHICHAAGDDIEGFADKPVQYRWRLVKMPTAPLLRLEIIIVDQPENPYRFESFLNVGDEEQVDVLAQLASQSKLFLAFYDEMLDYQYTKILPHDEQQWQQLDELWEQAVFYLDNIPPDRRDFNLAKAQFMSRVE